MEPDSPNFRDMTHELAVSRARSKVAKRRVFGELLSKVESEIRVDLAVNPVLKKLNLATGDEQICVVCFCKKKGDEGNVMAIECGHKYHDHCILKWLKNNNTCPICRHEIKIDRRLIYGKAAGCWVFAARAALLERGTAVVVQTLHPM